MSIFSDAESRLNKAHQEAGFALGALERATHDDISLMGGYTGAQVAKQIREARTLMEKAQERLRVLDSQGKVAVR